MCMLPMDTQCPTFRLHSRVWVIDWQSLQGYNISSWRPASVDTEHGVKLPQNPASMGLSGHNDRCINGSASVLNIMRRRAACFLTPKNSIDVCSLWQPWGSC